MLNPTEEGNQRRPDFIWKLFKSSLKQVLHTKFEKQKFFETACNQGLETDLIFIKRK